MYYCTDCGRKFEEPNIAYIKQPYSMEEIVYCPNCYSENIREEDARYCRCCGKKLKDKKRWYCSEECKKRGELLWKIQRERKRREKGSSLIKLSVKIEEYNKAHGTTLSYGFFVANVLPKMSKEERKEYI